MRTRGNIYGRLEKLEARTPNPQAGAGGERVETLVKKFIRQALDATAHIRRASIDRPQWRYEVERLRDESPFVIAAYVAALAAASHPDEEEAREILAEAQEEREANESSSETLWTLIKTFGRFVEGVESGRGEG